MMTHMAVHRRFLRFALVATLAVAGCDEAAPIVTTNVGRFEGVRRDGVLGFVGIRYAEPPIGELRWKPPVPVGFVEGLVAARTFGSQPPQIEDPNEQAGFFPQAEDCLYANVWTPSLDGSRPVMVFVHGGGFVVSGAADPAYYGAHLAERGDMVVVTFDYRIGPLGFLDLSAVGGADYASSGNLGVLDMIAALRWVRENIAAFGGDPENVTLMGQSAGSTSVALLMALPESRGLFRRAIAQSGALNNLRTQATARVTTERFMQLAGVTDLQGLQALSLERLMEVEASLESETAVKLALYGPVLDGALIDEPPLHAIARGDAADIPLLTGTTLDEATYFYLYFSWLQSLPPRSAISLLPSIASLFTPEELEALIVGYETRHPEASPGELTSMIGTDAGTRLGQIRLAEAQAVHQPNTFMYLFSWKTPVADGIYGATHGLDRPFVFRTFGTPSVDDMVGSAPPLGLSDAMIDAWASFARTSVPSANGLPTWPAYDANHRSTMVLDETSAVEDDPYAGDRQAWSAIPFDSIVPAN